VHLARLATFVIGLTAACRSPAPVPARPVPDQVVVLVSIDGFRADFLDRPGAARMRAIAGAGVRARVMEPVFPSKTFPTHYSIVTGLHPEHHGIVGNTMEDAGIGRFTIGDSAAVSDGRWWGGEPIWVTAERQGRKTAAFFWPGSEAPIQGVRPTWWTRFDARVPHETRINQVLDWLRMPAGQGPAFVTMYLSNVDSEAHAGGPDSPRADAAIVRADSAVGALWDGIQALGLGDRVNLIVVSDHGMTATSRDRVILLDEVLAAGTYRVVDWNPVAMIVPAEGKEQEVYDRLSRVPHLTTWRKAEVPERLHFRAHRRITPIVAAADDGWTISSRPFLSRSFSLGMHGYDNRLPSMQSLFVAAGPAFPTGRTVDRVRMVDVYALMTAILGIRPAPHDGSLDSIRVVLR
jgi:predicted AlkP superfamily pyrophosphatase or phosphodiesterase